MTHVKHAATAHGTLASYSIGFVLSVICTLLAFWVTNQHLSSGHESISHSLLTWVIVVLAVVQLFVQLVLFLHLGKEPKPRWNSIAFAFMLMVVGIVVLGSVWIMANLDYHTMSENGTDKYMVEQGQKGF